jgi:hypothetical protein
LETLRANEQEVKRAEKNAWENGQKRREIRIENHETRRVEDEVVGENVKREAKDEAIFQLKRKLAKEQEVRRAGENDDKVIDLSDISELISIFSSLLN